MYTIRRKPSRERQWILVIQGGNPDLILKHGPWRTHGPRDRPEDNWRVRLHVQTKPGVPYAVLPYVGDGTGVSDS